MVSPNDCLYINTNAFGHSYRISSGPMYEAKLNVINGLRTGFWEMVKAVLAVLGNLA